MTDSVDALIALNTMVAFTPGIAAQDRDDITNMLMYADFFASQSYRAQDNWGSWLGYYRSQLISAGCTLKSPLVHEAVLITDASELDTLGFGLKGAVSAGHLLELVQRTFKASRLSEYARHFFQYGSGPGSLNSFQVVPCEEVDETGEIRILLCGLHASATANTDFIGGDWRVNREMVVRLGGGLYGFKRAAYAPHRKRISARLVDVGRFNIRNIVI